MRESRVFVHGSSERRRRDVCLYKMGKGESIHMSQVEEKEPFYERERKKEKMSDPRSGLWVWD